MNETENRVKTNTTRGKFNQFVENNRSFLLSSAIGLPVVILFIQPAFELGTDTRYFLDSFAFVFLFAAMALTLNLETGFLGIPNFGKVAFIAIGAYTYAIVEEYNKDHKNILGLSTVFTGLVLAVIITAISGIVLTIPTLRLREDYLAITTLVAGEMLRRVFNNEESLGGFSGFGVTNVVFQEYDTDAFITGIYLGLNQIILVFILLGISYGTYLYYLSQYKTIYEGNKSIDYALQKTITFTAIASTILIILNFKGFIPDIKGILGDNKMRFLDNPSISFDIFAIIIPIGLILYRVGLHWNIDTIKLLYVYLILSGLAVISFIIGQDKDSQGVSNLNVVNWYFMLFALLTMLIIYITMEAIYFSPFGRAMRAIREDDTSAISVGKSLFGLRLRGLLVASALTGFVGAVYAMLLTGVSPQTFLPLLTFQLYIMVIIGGRANNKGVIYGAVVIQLLIQTTRRLKQNTYEYPPIIRDIMDKQYLNPFNWALIIVGILLILFLIYSPEGIFPEEVEHNERYRDLLYLNDEDPEKIRDNKLLNYLIQLSKSPLEPPEAEVEF
ncbi:MAG: branched-chain amino acid ABC transporter permease [Candidatus Kariarchaeaceae archaeon]|jgi:ABC-type branched-subunit amino acid transport system permease subunit